jgi:hypothetical protein
VTFKDFLLRLTAFLLIFFAIDFSVSKLMEKGLNKFYGFDKKPEILINGSSMTLSGFHKSDIEKQLNKKVAVYAKEGVGVEDRHAMLAQFFSEHPGTVNTVIYEINPLLFSSKLTAANVYTIFYPFIDNDSIDEYIKNRAGTTDYFIHKYCRAVRYDALTVNFVLKGYMNNYDNFKTISLDSGTHYFPEIENGKVMIENSTAKVNVFEKTMKLLQMNNNKVVLVMMPIYYQKQATFDSSGYNSLVSYYKKYTASNKNITYLDLNTGDLSHNALLFSDLLHLNREGQKKITEAVARFLKNRDSLNVK